MNQQLVNDIAKGIKSESINQELSPGSPRRYTPEGGVRRHNERIHKESKYADDWKSLPFSFRKPPKPRGRSTAIICDNCGHITHGSTATVGMICTACKKFVSVSEIEVDG